MVDTVGGEAGVALKQSDLVGTYKLSKVLREIVATGEVKDMTGANGHGRVMYGPDGNMMVLINYDGRPQADRVEDLTDEDRVKLFKTTIAYGGKYRIDGNQVSHDIEISWNDVWTGNTVVREIRRDGDKMIYIAHPSTASDTGEIIVTGLLWEKL